MRMNSLQMQAFGPFPSAQAVDFDELGADGLFLISGPTGAGKTTILDALAFGLYGTVPGARSDAEDYRSHYADPDTPTYVEVEFTAQARRWRVRRSPRYMRSKKRGTGMTEAKATAELSVFNPESGHWDGIGRTVSEVQAEINRVLGLNAAQFMQIVLLPQGEFARFLRADPIEREPILRRLFNTEHFTELETILEVRARQARAALEAVSQERQALMRQAQGSCGEDLPITAAAHPSIADVDAVLGAAVSVVRERIEIFTALLQSARARAADAEAAADTAAARQADRAKLTQLRSRQEAYTASADERTQLTQLQRRALTAEQVAPYEREADRAAREQEAAVEQQTAALRAFNTELAALPRQPETPSPEHTVQAAGDGQRAAASIATHLARVDELTLKRAELQHQQSAATSRVTELEEQTTAQNAALDELNARIESRGDVQQEHDRLNRALEAAEVRQQRSDEITAAQQRLDAQQEALKARQDEEAAAQHAYARIRSTRLAGIAAELAAELTPGDACSVCGSTTHPAPAEPGDDTVTKADEDAALRAWTQAQSAANTSRSTLAETSARIIALKRSLDELAGEQTTATADDLTQARDTAAQTLRELEQARTKRDELRQRRAALEQQQASAREHAQACATELSAVEGQLKQLDDVVSGDQEAALHPFGFEAPSTSAAAEECAAQLQRLRDAGETLIQTQTKREAAAAESAQRGDAFATALAEAGFADRGEYQEAREIDRADVEKSLRDAADEAARIAELTSQDWYTFASADTASDEELTACVAITAEHHTTASSDAEHLGQLLAVHRHDAADLIQLRERFMQTADEVEAEVAQHRGDVALDGIVRATSADNLQRLPLSSYALLSLFVEVAHNASERLQTMSGGRFTLIHDLSLHRREKRAGLGLQVLDTFTDEPRDPRSLSGGETFMASLALALGLADTVAAAAGGIRLDSLFIDEGFGSLDPDALAQVLEVLDELRAGGRCVGVISHVQSMLQSIPQQLRIERSPTGSTITHRSSPDS
ncbi:SMC family ATPase [Brevibacterium sp. p3-SID960]|uniref:AAA family ATPase n=1 Tax=Brevibacterium sp. p3-SID960 TaxID=2916063 RepID=UPI0021A64C31|nr:SMC family ATPase [Brevibacterium sp. p3-SID960]MCT1691850.1 SMC family ATPase [Brevibacterium sp. p3-SID960]